MDVVVVESRVKMLSGRCSWEETRWHMVLNSACSNLWDMRCWNVSGCYWKEVGDVRLYRFRLICVTSYT